MQSSLLIIYQLAYFMPFYFQAVQGTSATKSGIRFIALALPEIVAIVVSGAIVSMVGHYVSKISCLSVHMTDTRFRFLS